MGKSQRTIGNIIFVILMGCTLYRTRVLAKWISHACRICRIVPNTTYLNKMSTDGDSASSLYKVYRITTTALSLIILIGLTIYIFYDSFQVPRLYSWHPSFFTLGVSKCINSWIFYAILFYLSDSSIYLLYFIGFEVFTAVVMKSIIFWDMTPCSPLSFNQQTRLLAGFLNLFLRPWRWRRHVPPKRRLKLTGQHGVISQKMILFTVFHFQHTMGTNTAIPGI
jgi:membrane protein YdbS with pleckstrin-like domain